MKDVAMKRGTVLARLWLVAAVLCLMFTATPTVKSEVASSVEMNQVCQNWLTNIVFETGSWAGSQNPSITGYSDIMSGDTLLARWFDISPRGFVLVPVLKEMAPVKAYSDESVLDSRQADGFIELVKEYLSRVYGSYVRVYGSLNAAQPATGPAVLGQGQRSEWNTLTLSTDEYKASLQSSRRLPLAQAGPLLTSSWHQRVPYNNLCPMGDAGRTVVGCVATAAAQIMNFWKWPVNGVGTHTYTWEGDNSCGGSTPPQELTADFTKTYDWAHMIDSCDNGCTPADTTALAQLNYDVGVAFDMMYGRCGSGSYVTMAAQVLPQYFKYSSEATVVYRTQYDLPGWFAIIKDQIDKGQPTDYGISRHSIVCDGYRDDGGQYQYHMNYGWGGSFTTWFLLDSLYCYWEPDSLCPSSIDHMVINIKPQDKPILQFVGSTVNDNSGDNDGHAEPGETVSLNAIIKNSGLDASTITGTLATSDPYVDITTSSASFPNLAWGAQAPAAPPGFAFHVSPSCPDPHVITFTLTITASGGYSSFDTLYVFSGNKTGFSDNMDAGQGSWSHSSFTPAYGDQWHSETYRSHSAPNSWKMGGGGSAIYGDLLDAALITPPFLLHAVAPKLTFWHWIAAETNTSNTAWDGAVVMISSGDGTWTQLTPVGGYPYTVFANPQSPFAAGTPCFSGNHGWAKAEFDLTGYSGVVQLMFRFGADGNTAYEGWYIDDVDVSGTGCCKNKTGNIDGDSGDLTDITDLSVMVDYLFAGGSISTCPEENDVDRSSAVDISDLSLLVDFLFSGASLPSCP